MERTKRATRGGPFSCESRSTRYMEPAERVEVSVKDLSWFIFCWPDRWRLRHQFQASIPAPAIAALRILLEPKVSFRTWRLLFPNPNMCCLLHADADIAARQWFFRLQFGNYAPVEQRL